MTMNKLLQSAKYISSSVKDGALYSFSAGRTQISFSTSLVASGDVFLSFTTAQAAMLLMFPSISSPPGAFATGSGGAFFSSSCGSTSGGAIVGSVTESPAIEFRNEGPSILGAVFLSAYLLALSFASADVILLLSSAVSSILLVPPRELMISILLF